LRSKIRLTELRVSSCSPERYWSVVAIIFIWLFALVKW
jgi:hypothetical protein